MYKPPLCQTEINYSNPQAGSGLEVALKKTLSLLFFHLIPGNWCG